MKKLLLVLIACLPFQAQATEMCNVQVCNKLKRITLDPWKMLKDSMGETCFVITLPKEQAVVGKKLSSESRWYQGSFNPTKRSVTAVKQVYECSEVIND